MENFVVGIVFVAVLLFIAFLLVAIFTEESAERAAGGVAGRRRRRTGEITGLTAKMYLSLAAFAISVLFFGYDWLTEEARMKTAEAHLIERALERGSHTFAANCASCHGARGEGLVGPSLAVSELVKRHEWDLNNPIDQRKMEEFLRNTIAYGWPPAYRGEKPRMPAWSAKGGGTLNDEQIYELVTLIQQGDRWEDVAKVAAHREGAGAAPAEGAAQPGDPVSLGRQLYTEKGCVACHGRQLEGGVGPALKGTKSKPQIAGVIPNNEENLKRWLANPPGVKPGTAMPNLNLKPEEVDALVAFLNTQ